MDRVQGKLQHKLNSTNTVLRCVRAKYVHRYDSLRIRCCAACAQSMYIDMKTILTECRISGACVGIQCRQKKQYTLMFSSACHVDHVLT